MEKQKSYSATATITKAGLLAGTLDILCALVQFYMRTGKNPAAVLKFIASGIFGKAALAGGTEMALLGLLFHFIIAFTWTIIFFFFYPQISHVTKNKIIAGLLYGLFIYAVMTRVVLPLSNTPKIPFNAVQAAIGIILLMFAVGLPISLIVSRFYSVNKELTPAQHAKMTT
ncbi:MAG: hypothetical protein HYZ10_00880 [Ignavibacteriales bacterium]|nr:hypothetical protein [Ignavibacteriales bacterium]